LQLLEQEGSDLKIKADMAQKDREQLKKKLDNTSKEQTEMTFKERELFGKLEEAQATIKEKDAALEKKADDCFNLKQIID